MNELLWAAAVGAAFGAGVWWGGRVVCHKLATFAVTNPIGFLAFAERVASNSPRYKA